ncbi:MAG: type VI secretion system ATPase TssH, partial [Proteobacteria bacterium]|nr:type VI secretion system ATPase TssH [Pseudomonadota bacterium]
MDINKLTQKSQEALQEAQKMAIESGHNEVDVDHLLISLLRQSGGLIPKLVSSAGANTDALIQRIEAGLSKKPRTSGSGYDPTKIFLSGRLSRLFVSAEKEAQRLKDEYVSVEHLFIEALKLDDKSDASKALKDLGPKLADFMKALTALRGNQRVQSNTPEDTYEAL